MPQKSLVRQTPAVLIFPQEIRERVSVQSRPPRPYKNSIIKVSPITKAKRPLTNPAHHAGAEDPLRNRHLPVVPPVVKHLGAAHAGRAAAPIRMEVGEPQVVSEQPHLRTLVAAAPRPRVHGGVTQRTSDGLLAILSRVLAIRVLRMLYHLQARSAGFLDAATETAMVGFW